MSAESHPDRVVVCAATPGEATEISALLAGHSIEAVPCPDAAQFHELLAKGAGALLLTQEVLDSSHCAEITAVLNAQPAWSKLPVLILVDSPSGICARLTRVMAATTVTLVNRPTATEHLLQALNTALNARRRQYLIRWLLEAPETRTAAAAQPASARVVDPTAQARPVFPSWAEATGNPVRTALAGYAVATAAILGALALRSVFHPVLQDRFPFTTLYAAVAVAVAFGGLGPALWTAVAGYVAAILLFTDRHPIFENTAMDLAGALLYAVGASVIVGFGLKLKRAQQQARSNARLALSLQREAESALATRREAEERAHESSERLRVALMNSRFVLCEIDRNLRYRWVQHPDPNFNRAAFLGRRYDEIDLTPGGLALTEHMRLVLETGQRREFDIICSPQGEPRAFSITIEPLRDAAGELVGATIAGVDINERKQMEDALRQSEERARQQFAELEAIYHTAPLGLAVIDRELRFRRINERLAQMNGVPVADHIGRTVWEIVPAVADQAAGILRQVLENGAPVYGELKGVTAAQPGVERIWAESWYPLRDGSGTIVAVGVVADEVTERYRNEKALRESEELFRALAENVPQLAWMARPDGFIFWYNRRWFDYTGTTLTEMQGWGWQSVHHEEHVARVVEGYREAVESGAAWEDTFPLRGKDGHYRWFLSRAFPIRDADGRITRWFGSNTDVTVLRETQQALREAQLHVRLYAEGLERTVAERTAKLTATIHELEGLSYSIAHDMRAPLRSMIGYSDILCEEHQAGLNPDGREYLRRIAASGRRLDRLIQDVLDYTRVVRGELPLEPVDLCKLLNELLESYPGIAARRSCICLGCDLPTLRANRAALTQVLSNLLDNAIKFVPKGAEPAVRIGSRAAEPPNSSASGFGRTWALVEIEDNGIGIDPDHHPRLFQMFQRFTPPGTYDGNGIGLAIARKAIERMGGAIGCDSCVGKGSRFWFVLPRLDPPGAA